MTEKSPIVVVVCGCCGHYHLAPLTGDLYLDDCRYDGNRLQLGTA